jgi:hypothetical protein
MKSAPADRGAVTDRDVAKAAFKHESAANLAFRTDFEIGSRLGIDTYIDMHALETGPGTLDDPLRPCPGHQVEVRIVKIMRAHDFNPLEDHTQVIGGAIALRQLDVDYDFRSIDKLDDQIVVIVDAR